MEVFMKIIVVGAGKLGANLISLLCGEDHDITVIDTSIKLVETVVNNNDVIGCCGNGASFTVLEQAGAEKCDVLIAVTGSDELNIMSCMVAKRVGAKKTLARVRNTDYAGQLLFMQNKLGIDLIINPELETALEIARIVEFPSATKVETFAKGRIDLAEITIAKDSPLDGLKLMNLRRDLDLPMLICAVSRDDEIFIPSGGFVLKAGDKIYFTSARGSLSKIFLNLGIRKKKIRSALLIGGSRTSFYLAQILLKHGIQVKIIETNPARAAEIESSLDGASIICGDGTDIELLEEEGIGDFDATVCLTDIDEENIIISMYAERKGVRKIVCKANRDAIVQMAASTLPTCSVVCPKDTTCAIILRYIRAVSELEGSRIKTLYKILEGRAEAVEFTAEKESALIGNPLRELNLKEGIIIACISRGREVIIPSGNTEIDAGDSVIVITAGSPLAGLDEILR